MGDAVSAHVAARNGGVSISGVVVVYKALGTLSSSFAVRHHAWMLANAVSQRVAWVLVPLPLNHCVSDAVSTHVVRRKGGASILGADGVLT